MAAASRLGRQLEEIVTTMESLDAPFALIDLKLQGYSNNPRRTQDLADIRALIAANRTTLDMDEVREYFALFGKEALLERTLPVSDYGGSLVGARKVVALE